MPSKSQLFLVSKDLTTSHRWLGPNCSKLRLATFGLSGMRLIGAVEVGRTELEMELPILLKNLLNSSAMHDGSDICFPSTVIFSILELDFTPMVASFQFPMFFWGFLHFH
jgi:hypothetical protein